MNGIGFPGAPYEHVFYVADTEVTGAMVPNELNVYIWKKGFHLFFPMRGRNAWRVIGIIPAHLQDKPDLRFDDLIPTLQHEGGTALDFKSCSWFSTYRIHHRCTERFRKGRSFLLGDAAHVHSPAGGQGMNTGLQDAYNLAWKLALVIAGRADDSLLDTYEAERRPVAERLLATTDRAFMLVVSDTWLAGLLRTRVITKVVAFAMKRAAARRLAFMTLSQIGIRYRKSPLSRTLAAPGDDHPQAGDRFPYIKGVFEALDDTRFNLIVIGQPAPTAESLGLGDMLRVHTIPDEGTPRYYVLRPDGHIGLAGTRFEESAMKNWLADCHLRLADKTRDEAA
jgi:hypothetical protein